MKSLRQGRTGAASAVSREAHAQRLWVVLQRICRQLRRAQRDPEVRKAYLGVETRLAAAARQNKAGRKSRRTRR